MKKFLIVPLVFALGGLLPTAAMAEEGSGLTITPMAGFYDFDSGREIDDTGHYSIDIGWQFNEKWGVEAGYVSADTETETTANDVDFYAWRINGLYHLGAPHDFKPFFLFGAGENVYDANNGSSERQNFIDYGVGMLFAFNDVVAVRSDIRAVTDIDDSSGNDTDIVFSLGLQFLVDFDRSPRPVPAP